MNKASLPKGFPTTTEEWEKLIAEAPGEDRPPTPEEEAAWKDAVLVLEGGVPAVRAALAEKRRQRGRSFLSSASRDACAM